MTLTVAYLPPRLKAHLAFVDQQATAVVTDAILQCDPASPDWTAAVAAELAATIDIENLWNSAGALTDEVVTFAAACGMPVDPDVLSRLVATIQATSPV